MGLSKEQVGRYGRQLILPEVGVPGQQRIAQAKVLVVGAGGLGSPAALYLAAAGVGRLGIIDREVVEPSNLHRQILHGTGDVGRPKTASAKARLDALNPETVVVPIQEALTADNAMELLGEYDLVLDGSDNLPTRYLVNDACVLLRKPLVHGGVVGFDGQLMTILPGQGPCFRCVFPEPPEPGAIPTCGQAGILGAVAGVIGGLMAQEALKLVLGAGEPLVGRLLTFDGRRSAFREVPIRRDLSCAVCGNTPTIRTLQSRESVCHSS